MPVQVAAAAKKEPQTRIQFTSLWNPKIKNIGSRQKEKKTGQRNWGYGPKKIETLKWKNVATAFSFTAFTSIRVKKYVQKPLYTMHYFLLSQKNSNQNTNLPFSPCSLESVSGLPTGKFPHKLKESQMHRYVDILNMYVYICEHWTMYFYFRFKYILIYKVCRSFKKSEYIVWWEEFKEHKIGWGVKQSQSLRQPLLRQWDQWAKA